jgi:protein SCO1/2
VSPRAVVALATLLLAAPASAGRAQLAAAADLEEHLGARLPAALGFIDQDGHAATLGRRAGDGLPTVLVLAYFRCPMLCDLVLEGVVRALSQQGLQLGRDFRALTVSFDPQDTAQAAALKQRGVLQAFGRLETAWAWPFWVGQPDAVRALTDTVGFRYAYDPATHEFAHPAVAIVLTPDGRISRYLYGVRPRPLDLRLALVEASRGKVGGIVDRVLLTCLRYDAASRKYGPFVSGVLRGGAGLVLLLFLGGLLILRRRERGRA